MKIIPTIAIFLLIASNSMAQNSLKMEKKNYDYIELIRTTFFQNKPVKVKKIRFLKYLRYQKKLSLFQDREKLHYRISDQLLDTANQQIVVEITCDNMELSDLNSDARNILALIDIEKNSVISILGTNILLGFHSIHLTKDYIITTEPGNSGLLTWDRITGKSYENTSYEKIHDIKEVRADSNDILIRTGCCHRHMRSDWVDIKDFID